MFLCSKGPINGLGHMMTDDYNRPQEGLPSEYRWNMAGKIPENVEMVFRLLIYVICDLQNTTT